MTEAERAAMRAENAALRAKLEAAERVMTQVTTPPTDGERDALARLQSRADSVAAGLGVLAPAPHPGEPSLAYRKRLLAKFQTHSPKFAGLSLNAATGTVLDAIEQQVYADAATASTSAAHPAGVLIPVRESRGGGLHVTKYHGDPLAWMAPFMATGNVCHIDRAGAP